MALTGPRNSIADVSGLSVGNAHDAKLASGVTALLAESAAVAAASVFGGGPGSRELDAIRLEGSAGAADAVYRQRVRHSVSTRPAEYKAICAKKAGASL